MNTIMNAYKIRSQENYYIYTLLSTCISKTIVLGCNFGADWMWFGFQFDWFTTAYCNTHLQFKKEEELCQYLF